MSDKGNPQDAPGQEGVSYWSIVRRQYRKDKLAMVGLALVGFLVMVAMLAPLLANDRPIVMKYKGELMFPALPTYLDSFPVPGFIVDPLRKQFPILSNHYPQLKGATFKETIAGFQPGDDSWAVMPPVPYGFAEINPLHIKLRPGEQGHFLGTDDTGQDVFARMIHGTIISLSVGVVAVSIYVTIGIILGCLAGFFGGWIDIVISRSIEVMICFPTFFLIITVIAFLPRSIFNIMMVIGITGWTGVARLIRGEMLKAKGLDYALAAQALGMTQGRIIFRHVLPNIIAPVFVSATFGIASAVLTETSLSFLGFGVAPPTASWGEIVSQGRAYVTEGLFHLVIWPGLAICLTLIAFNLVGQGLRDAMDPRLRNS